MGEYAAGMREIWVRTRDLTLAHVADIVRFIESLEAGTSRRPDVDAGLRVAAIDAAHALRGVLGTFGMPAGCHLAQQVEELLDTELDATAVATLSGLARRLREAVEAGPESASPIDRSGVDSEQLEVDPT